jgi:hypothetical protein
LIGPGTSGFAKRVSSTLCERRGQP